MPFRDEENEDSTFDEVSAMADRLGLKGKNRAAYIDDHMVGLGYEPVQSRDSYIRREEEQEQSGPGSRWGIGRGAQQQGGRSRRRGDDDDSF